MSAKELICISLVLVIVAGVGFATNYLDIAGLAVIALVALLLGRRRI